MNEKKPIPPKFPYTFKANLSEYRRRLGLWRIVLAVSLTLIIFFRFGLVAWLVTVVGLAILIGTGIFLISRRSITLTEKEIRYVTMFGSTKTLPYSQIENPRAFMQFFDPGFGIMPRIIIGTKAKKPFLALTPLFWKPEDLDRMLIAFDSKGIQFEYFEDVADSAAITKQFPESLTYIEKHPYRIAFVIVILIIVLATGGVLMFM